MQLATQSIAKMISSFSFMRGMLYSVCTSTSLKAQTSEDSGTCANYMYRSAYIESAAGCSICMLYLQCSRVVLLVTMGT